MIAIIAAISRNGVIGARGKMPWHMPADLKHFRRLTKGHVVVMGRKTYESMGGALPRRHNVVLTRDASFAAAGCEVVGSVEAVLREERPVYIIGGAEVYRQFLPHADVLYLTRIDAEFEGDTFFPAFDESQWRVVSAVDRPKDDQNPYDCTFLEYRRSG